MISQAVFNVFLSSFCARFSVFERFILERRRIVRERKAGVEKPKSKNSLPFIIREHPEIYECPCRLSMFY
jgi:hypothetical protein